MSDATQEKLVAALSAGEVLGIPGPVERIDTHLSHVFLSRDKAYKLKRSVRLPFVDFSLLDERRTACESELAVNKSMAGDLYESVFPITLEAEGRFALGGAGPAADWVVAMRRFDRACQFDHLARANKLTRTHVEDAARTLARFHAASRPVMSCGYGEDYHGIIQKLRQTEHHGAVRFGLQVGSRPLFGRLESELSRVMDFIEARRREGRVRRGHGDLHLRNLCLFEGAPTPFDALEFDERLATTDVVYDLAFLLMDLRHFELPGHANAAMNAYWDESGEGEIALALAPFFTGLRAAVRMAVAVEAGNLVESNQYHDLGVRLLESERPIVLAIGGLSGVGKTAVARAVAANLPGPAGARLLRTDVLRKSSANLQTAFRTDEALYEPARRAQVYRDLTAHARDAASVGASVVADATFIEEASRREIESVSSCVHGYWLDAPLAVRLARIGGRSGDASDADETVAAAQEGTPLPPKWRRINANRPVDVIAAEILGDLGR